jgi:hypothetical protein
MAFSGVYRDMQGSLTLLFASDYNSRSCNVINTGSYDTLAVEVFRRRVVVLSGNTLRARTTCEPQEG